MARQTRAQLEESVGQLTKQLRILSERVERVEGQLKNRATFAEVEAEVERAVDAAMERHEQCYDHEPSPARQAGMI